MLRLGYRLRDGRMTQERLGDHWMLAMFEEGCGERSAEAVEVEALIFKSLFCRVKAWDSCVRSRA